MTQPSSYKLRPDAAAAVADIPDRATVLVGGFGLCGIPDESIRALAALGRTGLTLVSNNAGTTEHGLVHLLQAGAVRRILASYVGENAVFEDLALRGALELELVPQGSLAERLRAGGAGIPAFYTPTGVGTLVADGKEVRTFDGRPCLLETAIRGDFALVRAWKADPFGNLVFRKTARNFNPLVAMAGRVTIAEVEELCAPGELDPDHIHLPGVFVHRLFRAAASDKRIERRVVRAREDR
jgi:3-oxoacid CoA-transferase subunit A